MLWCSMKKYLCKNVVKCLYADKKDYLLQIRSWGFFIELLVTLHIEQLKTFSVWKHLKVTSKGYILVTGDKEHGKE